MRAFMFAAALLVAACTSSAKSPCPVTTPPAVAVTPPPPVGTGPNPTAVFVAARGSFLYGNDALVVILPTDGTLHPSDPSRGLAGGIKFPWWRIAQGDLVVATNRLDGATPAQSADVPAGYGEVGLQVSGLVFSTPGCWQVSGTVAGKNLTFVVNVSAD